MTYTIQQLCQRWQCSNQLIYDLLRTRQLHGFKVGKEWRISEKEVERFEAGDT